MNINDIFGKKPTDNGTKNRFRRKIKKTINKISLFNYRKISLFKTKSIPLIENQLLSIIKKLPGGKSTKLL